MSTLLEKEWLEADGRGGGLPFPLLEDATARAVVDAVKARLLTP